MPPATAASNAQLTKRPKDSDFYQQRLRAWQPILTPTWVIATFLAVGIPFIAIGIGLKVVSDGVVEYSVQYDGPGTNPTLLANCHVDTGISPRACRVSIVTDKEMKGTTYVYYQLDNFYQNHRRYVKSRSDKQLAGTVYDSAASVTDCDPLTTRNSKVLDPCGLIANSFFNDTFLMSATPAIAANMSEKDISWASDRSKKFKAITPDVQAQYPGVAFINSTYPNVKDVSDEHFIVWMRVAALPSFRKLYGHIDTTIPAGTTLDFDISANYPVSSFDGKKYLVISTVSFLGGKNPFLGIAYIVVGAICVALAAAFALRQLCGGRRLGDTSLLVWKK